MYALTLQSMPPQSKSIYSYQEWPSFSRLHGNHSSQTAKNLSIIDYVLANSRYSRLMSQALIAINYVDNEKEQTYFCN